MFVVASLQALQCLLLSKKIYTNYQYFQNSDLFLAELLKAAKTTTPWKIYQDFVGDKVFLVSRFYISCVKSYIILLNFYLKKKNSQ